MEAVFMSAGILTAIVLCVVGIIKSFFGKFKEKHPKWFKSIFTVLSIVLTFGACLINQAFILNQALFNTEFWVMLATTFGGVFGLYHTYEGVHVKELLKNLFVNIGKWFKTATPDSKVNKLVKKYGLDKVEVSLNVVKAQQAEITNVDVENAVVENTIVENQVINAEHVEINNAEVQNSTINAQN